ncbi:MAG: ABC transporter ATP-binding protein [Candidatus Omnitrophica bacterium]|nr:ABC transporter ATP-binding protein [Candidatus Omnitrophota bacterium]
MYNADCIIADNIGISFRLKHEKRNTIKKAIRTALLNGANKEKFWALRHVSFSIKKGEIVGIIGRNGSGKSTLLRIIAGIYVPDEGTVEVKEKVSTLLSLTAGFQPELSGYDNVYLSGFLLGMQKEHIDGIMEKIVAFSELGSFLDVPVKKYSSGMLARLGFSIAINIEQDILLIDEALAVGDNLFRKKCEESMEMLKKEGKTIIVVSHSVETIKNFCNKAIWLDKGRIQHQGDAGSVIEKYFYFLKKI